MTEKRGAPRQRTFLKGEIGVHGPSRLQCIIRDMSEDGACLVLSKGIVLPDPFRLYLPKFDRWVTASIRWRRGDNVGISLKTIKVDGSDQRYPLEEKRVGELEAELSKLRQFIDEIRTDPTKLASHIHDAA